MKNVALILAGGIGVRAKAKIPKQFLSFEDKPLIIYTIEKFNQFKNIDSIYIACLSEFKEELKNYLEKYNITTNVTILNGGETAFYSTLNGINEIKKHEDLETNVIIHDGNRPFITDEMITKLISTCNQYGNAICVEPTTDIIVKSDDSISSNHSIGREGFYYLQKPECYKLKDLIEIYDYAEHNDMSNALATCAIYLKLNKPIYFSPGSRQNMKFTYPEDIEVFNKLLK